MGKIKILVFIVTLSLLTFFSQSVQSQEILRIHILAHSNRPQDQFVKYQVRDEILNHYKAELKNIKGQTQLDKFVSENLEDIVHLSASVLAENGFGYSSQADVGEFSFPTRMYMDTVYPSGTYKAVKIVLGEGAGDNWWCVMFPPLCFVGEFKEAETPSNSSNTAIAAEQLEVDYEFIVVKWVKNIGTFFKNLF